MALPIGGFMPIPLAMMIPFMATQSMVMGDAFGQAFQYGKRKISAMSNEEFNQTTMEQLASNMFKAYENIIPDLKQSIIQSRNLQSLIVTELLRLPVSIFQDVTGTSKPRPIKEEDPEILGPSTGDSDIKSYDQPDNPPPTKSRPTTANTPTPTVETKTLTQNQILTLTNHYNKIIAELTAKITNRYRLLRPMLRDKNANGNPANPGGVKKHQDAIIKLGDELNKHYKYLKNVKAGRNPY